MPRVDILISIPFNVPGVPGGPLRSRAKRRIVHDATNVIDTIDKKEEDVVIVCVCVV
jgi:hypothetical protein